MFSKFKVEKSPPVLYKRGPRQFEIEQPVISLPLVEAYGNTSRQMRP